MLDVDRRSPTLALREARRDFTTDREIFRLTAVAVVVGAICGGVALALLRLIGLITNLALFHRFSTALVGADHDHLGLWVIPVPVAGALVVGLIARYGSEKIRGHGIPEALEAMLINGSRVQPRVAFWKPVSAAVAIGTGGPFGAEGPIIMTGGSLGSLVGQALHMTAVERRILLVAGAAGGMSATFGSPIAAVLFAVELLVFEFKPRSLVPIATASAVADLIRIQAVGSRPIFPMPQLHTVSLTLALAAAGIGVVGCLLAIVLTRAIYAVEDAFRRLPIHWMWWPALGAVVVGVGGYLAPRSLGVGYDSIGALVAGRLTLSVLAGLLLAKTVVWAVSLSSGTSGGILAPILIIGGSFGALAAHLCGAGHPGVWALLGMAAIFAGVTRSPFTSVIFPLELTHDMLALLPLLIASSVATGLSAFALPRSILTEKIARRGLHMTREYATDPLDMYLAGSIAQLPGLVLERTRTVADALAALLGEGGGGRWLGIVRENGTLLAACGLAQLLERERRPGGADAPLGELVPETVAWVRSTDTAKHALHAMIEGHDSWALVQAPSGEAMGVITIDDLLDLRRHELRSERDRERALTLRRPAEALVPAD